jgi:hypothetical protein
MWRNIVPKQKPCGGKYCSNLQYFFIKKTTKLNSQPVQYEKKNHVGGNTVVIYNVFL